MDAGLTTIISAASTLMGAFQTISGFIGGGPEVPNFEPQFREQENRLGFANSLRNANEQSLSNQLADPNLSQFQRNAINNELRIRQEEKSFDKTFQEKLAFDREAAARVDAAVNAFNESVQPDVLSARINSQAESEAEINKARFLEGLAEQMTLAEQRALRSGMAGSRGFADQRGRTLRDADLALLSIEDSAKRNAEAFVSQVLNAQSTGINHLRSGLSDDEARRRFQLQVEQAELNFQRASANAATQSELEFAKEKLRQQQELALEKFKLDVAEDRANRQQALGLLTGSLSDGGLDKIFTSGTQQSQASAGQNVAKSNKLNPSPPVMSFQNAPLPKTYQAPALKNPFANKI